VALALVSPATGFAGAVGATALLTLFIVAIAGNLLLGRRPGCNCFGQRRGAAISRRTLARNGALWALAVLLVLAGPANRGLDAARWIAGLSSGVLAGAAAGLLGIGLLTAQCLLLLRVARPNAQILKHLAAPPAPRSAPTAPAPEPAGARADTLASALAGLRPGTPAPAFSLGNLEGATMTLASLQSPDKPLVLVFADAACGPCRALRPDVALWQAQYPDTFGLAVISRGTADANLEKFAALGRPLANAEAEIRSLIWRLVKPGAPEPAPAVAPARVRAGASSVVKVRAPCREAPLTPAPRGPSGRASAA
jgi:hypothetical protein